LPCWEHADVYRDIAGALLAFAEASVSRDLQGNDSVDKLRILAHLAFCAASDAIAISRQGSR
jgi:homoserine dehydrogenase